MPAEYKPEQTNFSLSKAGLKGIQLLLTAPHLLWSGKLRSRLARLVLSRLLSLSDARETPSGVNTLHKRQEENGPGTTKEDSMASVSLTLRVDPGFPGGLVVKTCLWCRRHRLEFDPWVRTIPWRRKWPPTPVSLPGKFHGQRSLAGYSPWVCRRVKHDWVANNKNEWPKSLSSQTNTYFFVFILVQLRNIFHIFEFKDPVGGFCLVFSSLLIHSPMERHGCFQVLATIIKPLYASVCRFCMNSFEFLMNTEIVLLYVTQPSELGRWPSVLYSCQL